MSKRSRDEWQHCDSRARVPYAFLISSSSLGRHFASYHHTFRFLPLTLSIHNTIAPGLINDSPINSNTLSSTPCLPNVQPGRPAQPLHALVAGAVGGYLIWGQWSAISHQVLLYISIRVLAALWKLLKPIHRQEDWRLTHRLAATVAWATVMYLWERHPDKLQSSMRKSMNEIYDSGWWLDFFGNQSQLPGSNDASSASRRRHAQNLSA